MTLNRRPSPSPARPGSWPLVGAGADAARRDVGAVGAGDVQRLERRCGLTDKLVESGWMKNDAGRGFKTMQIYRADCPKSARIELQIALKDNKAMRLWRCSRGDKLDGGADYLMWAETPRWREMGAGDYGPMRAMMFGYLNFEGPKMEAMGNMAPSRLLRLVGKVPGEWGTCA